MIYIFGCLLIFLTGKPSIFFIPRSYIYPNFYIYSLSILSIFIIYLFIYAFMGGHPILCFRYNSKPLLNTYFFTVKVTIFIFWWKTTHNLLLSIYLSIYLSRAGTPANFFFRLRLLVFFSLSGAGSSFFSMGYYLSIYLLMPSAKSFVGTLQYVAPVLYNHYLSIYWCLQLSRLWVHFSTSALYYIITIYLSIDAFS